MAWDKTQPANNAALLSPPIRANWDALDLALMAPLTALANGQVLTKSGGVLAGVPAGTNGYILTLVGGVPLWQPGALAYPLLAPDGTQPAPSYAFAAVPGTGLARNIFGGAELDFVVAGAPYAWVQPNVFVLYESALLFTSDNAHDIGAAPANNRPRYIFVGTGLQTPLIDYPVAAAPATPAAGHVISYAKTDKKLYAKDDAGVETPLGGGGSVTHVPLSLDAARFPDGTANNGFPQPVERVSSAQSQTYVPKPVELVYYFDQTIYEHLIWKGVVPPGYAGGAITMVVKFSMVSATTGNIRLAVGMAFVVDGSTDVRAVDLGANAPVSADIAVPATLGQSKEIRLSIAPTGGGGAAAGRKFIVSAGLIGAAAANATSDRVLEAAWLEFAQ